MAFEREEERGAPARSQTASRAAAAAQQAHIANHRIVGMTLVTASLATFAAVTFPEPVILSTLSTLLMVVAALSAGAAVLMRHRPFASHLTLWDKAAALFALSLVVGLTAGGPGVQALLDAHATGAAL